MALSEKDIDWGPAENTQSAGSNIDWGAVPKAPLIKPSNNPYINAARRQPLDVVAGAENFVRGLANTPHNLLNAIPASKLPEGFDLVGIQNPGFGEKMVADAAQYAPYALGYELLAAGEKGLEGLGFLSRMKNLSGQGIAYGLTQSEHPIKAATVGALLNPGMGAIAEGAIGGLKELGPAVINKLATYAGPGLKKQMAKLLSSNSESLAKDALNATKQNYAKSQAEESELWGKSKELAAKAPFGFDRDPYVNALQDRLKELGGASDRQAAFKTEYAQPIKHLEGFLPKGEASAAGGTGGSTYNDLPTALEHMQSVNKAYRNSFNPNTNSLKTNDELAQIDFARGAMKSTLKDQLKKPGLEELNESWTSANKKTSEIKNIFESAIGPDGKIGKSTFSRMVNNPNSVETTTFMDDYIPPKGEEGIERFQQLEKMTGDPVLTKEALRNRIFGPSVNAQELNAAPFLTKFDNLSKSQQEYLFDQPQINQIKALNKLWQNSKGKGSNSPFWHYTAPSIIGGLLSHPAGLSRFAGMVSGLGVAKLLEHAATNLLEHPAYSERMVQRLIRPEAENTFTPRPLRTNVQRALPAVVTAPLTQAANGDE